MPGYSDRLCHTELGVRLFCESATLKQLKLEGVHSRRNRKASMSETKESKTFDTVDHIAVAVSDVKGTVDWYLKISNAR